MWGTTIDTPTCGCQCWTITFHPDYSENYARPGCAVIISSQHSLNNELCLHACLCHPGGQNLFCRPFVGHKNVPLWAFPLSHSSLIDCPRTLTGPHTLGWTVDQHWVHSQRQTCPCPRGPVLDSQWARFIILLYWYFLLSAECVCIKSRSTHSAGKCLLSVTVLIQV